MNLQALLDAGFVKVGEWRSNDGDLILDTSANLNRPGAVYAFVAEGHVVYIGVAQRPLSQRLRLYSKPGPTQTTSKRLKLLLLGALDSRQIIEVVAIWPEPSEWKGLPVDTAAGIESALISSARPQWNKRGKPRQRIVLATPDATPDLPTVAINKVVERAAPTTVGTATNFWVYVNDVRKRGAIHVAHCSHCNNGRGLHGGGTRSNGYWRAFETRESANSFARSTGYPDVKPCKICGG